MADEWSDAELDAAVEAYLAMLGHQARGEDYSKAEYRRRYIAGPLSARPEASFEFRMRNISHVLDTELHADWLRGYRPAANVGAATTARIREALERQLGSPSVPSSPTFDPIELDERTKAARGRIAKARGALKPKGNLKPAAKTGTTTVFARDPMVRAWVLENADGVCEACSQPAPFKTAGGEPYLEVHHVVRLASDGPDVIENAVACCPNCHREAHLGGDGEGWVKAVRLKVARLREPAEIIAMSMGVVMDTEAKTATDT
jgi:5-methylcytosine-specific restriction protein A